MKYLSTKEVALRIGIGRATLERWLSVGKLRAPRTMQIGQGSFRRWTNADLERIRKYKAQNYRKGRGRKNAALQSQEPKK